MSYLVLDLIILVVLGLSAWQGARRGLIFTLFGLLAVVVALVGANLVATALTPQVSAVLEPRLTAAIQEQLGETVAQSVPSEEALLGEENPLSGILGLIQGTDIYHDVVEGITSAVEDGVEEATATLGGILARAIAQSVAHGVIYTISFVVILALWFVCARLLDFVCTLPVLSGLNTAGGLILGLLRGGLVVLAAAWLLCTFLGLIPKETVEESMVLKYFVNPGLLGRLFGLSL